MLKEFDNVKVGSKIEVYLERLEGFKGEVIVSRQKAKQMSSWKRMEKAFETQEEVEGTIQSSVKGGMVVNVNSCLAFLPGSQISTTPLKKFEISINTGNKIKIEKRRLEITHLLFSRIKLFLFTSNL